ncbi:MAG: hypothetical protein SGI99_13030 [Pseudomonadota bacterium]|nr:hypothetical protein [Pseudomonadota bacterium]
MICICSLLAGCVTTNADGRTYLHHFGYARILIEPDPASAVDITDTRANAQALGSHERVRRGDLSNTHLLGLWFGPEIGIGYRHQIRATTPKGCHLAVHAQGEQQLERFIEMLHSAGITGENLCAVPLSL